MKIAIIDDEESAQNVLQDLLLQYCPGVIIVGIAANVQEGLNLIEQCSPELLFLDIEMPDGSGFDLLEKIPEIDFKVIFTTAHEKYAVQAFKFSAIDYLLKPIEPEDLIQAVQKAQESTEKEVLHLKVSALLENIRDMSQGLKKIVLRDAENIHIASIGDIIRLEASGNYTLFYLKDNTQIVVSKSLKEYEKMLANSGFFRSHQSHLINLNAFKRYEKRDGGLIIMQDGSSIPLARRKKDTLLALLNNL